MQPRGIFHLSFRVLTVCEIPAFASQIGGRWTILWCFERAINYISILSPGLSEKIKIPFYNVLNNNIKQSGAESVAEMCFMNRNFTSSRNGYTFQSGNSSFRESDWRIIPDFPESRRCKIRWCSKRPRGMLLFIGKTFQTQP